jgi:hypothetical protein
MAETKASKLSKFQNKRHQLRVKLIELTVARETYHKTNDDSLHHFYSMRNSRHNAHRDRLRTQIRKIERQIEMYDRKIQSL